LHVYAEKKHGRYLMDDVATVALRMSAATQLVARVIADFELNEDEREAAGEILKLIAWRMSSVAVKASS